MLFVPPLPLWKKSKESFGLEKMVIKNWRTKCGIFPPKLTDFAPKLANFVPILPKNWPFITISYPYSAVQCNFLFSYPYSALAEHLRAERLVGHLPWVPPPGTYYFSGRKWGVKHRLWGKYNARVWWWDHEFEFGGFLLAIRWKNNRNHRHICNSFK